MLSVLQGGCQHRVVKARQRWYTHGLKPVLLPVKSKQSASVMAKSHTAFPPSAKAEMIWIRRIEQRHEGRRHGTYLGGCQAQACKVDGDEVICAGGYAECWC